MQIVTDRQYDEFWWKARRGVPSASRASKILTSTGKLGTQVPYIYDLIGQQYDVDYGIVEDYQSAAMKNGLIIEPEARRFYEFDRNVEVVEVGFCTSDDGRWGFSPDALCGSRENPEGGVEIKSPQANTQVKWLTDNKLPAAHASQVRFSLVASGLPWWDLMSYCRNLPALCIRVYADDPKVKEMAEAMDAFWDKYQTYLKQIIEMIDNTESFQKKERNEAEETTPVLF